MAQGIDLSGKVVLITGANRGIGKALVDAVVAAGAVKVYAGARNPESVESDSEVVVATKLDVTNADDIAAVAADCADTEVLINNAGVLEIGTLGMNFQESMEKNFAVNVYGVAHLTEAMLPGLKEKEHPAIAVVDSVAGLANFPAAMTYSMSKAAAHSMIQGIRAQHRDIAVFGIYPGPIDTDMTQGWDMEKGSPEEVAREVIAGMAAGTEEIFSDAIAKEWGAIYESAPKKFEEAIGQFGEE